MKRKLWLGMIGLAAASTAQAAIVTLTMSYNESASSSGISAGSFAVYATVSQGDNRGLFAFGIDLTAGGENGVNLVAGSLVNRSPHGVWNIDQLDPNYDPDNVTYASYDGGFGTGRGSDDGSVPSTTPGVVSGVQDLAKGAKLVKIYGLGQTASTMNANKPAPFQNPDPPTSNGGQVAYADYTADANTDTRWGATPVNAAGGINNKAGVTTLPAGTVRLITGKWSGASRPTIQVGPTASTGISVWSLPDPTPGQENKNEKVEGNNLVIQYRDWNPVAGNTIGIGGTAVGTPVATGGQITVTGSNGSYSSEVDDLVGTNLTKGSAQIVTIGDEIGSIYVMAKLVGTAADISAFLTAQTNDVDATDPQFAPLHAAYDSRFSGGSFNGLFKITNIPGAKFINFDNSSAFPNVSIDQLAAVPEPATMGLMAFAGMGLLARRRRNRA